MFSKAKQSTILFKFQVSSNWTLSFIMDACLTGVSFSCLLLQAKARDFMRSFLYQTCLESILVSNRKWWTLVIKCSKCYSGSHHQYNKDTQQGLINSACGSWKGGPRRCCLDWYLIGMIGMHQWRVVENSWSFIPLGLHKCSIDNTSRPDIASTLNMYKPFLAIIPYTTQ